MPHCRHLIFSILFSYFRGISSYFHRVNAVLDIFCCKTTSNGILMDFFWAFCWFVSTLCDGFPYFLLLCPLLFLLFIVIQVDGLCCITNHLQNKRDQQKMFVVSLVHDNSVIQFNNIFTALLSYEDEIRLILWLLQHSQVLLFEFAEYDVYILKWCWFMLKTFHHFVNTHMCTPFLFLFLPSTWWNFWERKTTFIFHKI